MEAQYSETDKKVASKLIQFWTDFVKFGSPGTDWTPLGKDQDQKMQFQPSGEVSMTSFQDDYTEFWMEFYRDHPPKLVRNQFCKMKTKC